MREDSRVDYVLLGVLVFAFLSQAYLAVRKVADDGSWEMRFRSLDDLDRAWIAAASRTSTTRPALKERGEVDLAEGFGRRERRRLAYVELATLPIFIPLAFLIVAGALPSGMLALLLTGEFAVRGSLEFFRGSQIKTRYREAQDGHLATAAVQPTPAL
jgi:hypothetical protein